MAAYLIAQVEVTDPDTFAKYSQQVPGVIAQYGGRYKVRGGSSKAIEGAWAPDRLVVVEFDSMDQLETFYNSAEYAPLIELRTKSANTELTFVEGV